LHDLRRRVQEDPASIAFAQLAEEYRRAGAYGDAVEVCTAGLRRHPGYLSARVTLGRALAALDRLDEAVDQLELVRVSAPQNLAALRGLADIHRRRGDIASALQHYEAALALAPNDPDLDRRAHELRLAVAAAATRPEAIGGTLTAASDGLAMRTIAALEQWLAAIHVTRAQHAS
jgi:tetratricopeptide (TPR) repeat protein